MCSPSSHGIGSFGIPCCGTQFLQKFVIMCVCVFSMPFRHLQCAQCNRTKRAFYIIMRTLDTISDQRFSECARTKILSNCDFFVYAIYCSVTVISCWFVHANGCASCMEYGEWRMMIVSGAQSRPSLQQVMNERRYELFYYFLEWNMRLSFIRLNCD